jgi:hypothetical protein
MDKLTALLALLRVERPNITEVALATNSEGRWVISYKEGLNVTLPGMWFSTPEDAIWHVERVLRDEAAKKRADLERQLKVTNAVLAYPTLIERG